MSIEVCSIRAMVDYTIVDLWVVIPDPKFPWLGELFFTVGGSYSENPYLTVRQKGKIISWLKTSYPQIEQQAQVKGIEIIEAKFWKDDGLSDKKYALWRKFGFSGDAQKAIKIL